jgi:hypothetical protein
MLVYGIRCAPADLSLLTHTDTEADYYMDYGLLVFPQYTKGFCLTARGNLTDEYWSEVRRVIEQPHRVRAVEREHPYITEEEADILRVLRQYYPSLQTDWYYVPRVATMAHSTQE